MDVSERIVAFEVMRAASESRHPLWAAAMSAAVRLEGLGCDALKEQVSRALRHLMEKGYVFVFQVPRFWGAERVLSAEEVEAALTDDRTWRPRRLSVSKVLRLGITETGRRALESGAFGTASPIAWRPDWFPAGDAGRDDEPNVGQILAAMAGAALGGVAYAGLSSLWGGPRLAGADAVCITLLGLWAGVLLWYRARGGAEGQYEWNFRLPTFSVDELGDRRF